MTRPATFNFGPGRPGRPNVLATTPTLAPRHPAWLRAEGEGVAYFGRASAGVVPGGLDAWRAAVRQRAGGVLDAPPRDVSHLAADAVKAACEAMREEHAGGVNFLTGLQFDAGEGAGD